MKEINIKMWGGTSHAHPPRWCCLWITSGYELSESSWQARSHKDGPLGAKFNGERSWEIALLRYELFVSSYQW